MSLLVLYVCLEHCNLIVRIVTTVSQQYTSTHGVSMKVKRKSATHEADYDMGGDASLNWKRSVPGIRYGHRCHREATLTKSSTDMQCASDGLGIAPLAMHPQIRVRPSTELYVVAVNTGAIDYSDYRLTRCWLSFTGAALRWSCAQMRVTKPRDERKTESTLTSDASAEAAC